MSNGDQNTSGNDYYGFPMTVRSPTEQTHSLTTSNVDYMTESFQSKTKIGKVYIIVLNFIITDMSVTSYGHSPSTIPRGVYPTIAAQMNSSGSYHGDMTMVTTPTSNTMNGITSPVRNLILVNKLISHTISLHYSWPMGTTGQTVPLHWYLLNSRHIESSPAYKRGALKNQFFGKHFSLLCIIGNSLKYTTVFFIFTSKTKWRHCLCFGLHQTIFLRCYLF